MYSSADAVQYASIKTDVVTNLSTTLGTPESCRDTYTSKSGLTTVSFDDIVEIPDVNAVPIIEVALQTFSEEDERLFAEVAFEGVPYSLTGERDGFYTI